METNEKLREIILGIVDNQIAINDPPEVNHTFRRLSKLGYSKEDCRMLIGQCVSVEIFHVMKYKEEFNEKRYVKNLKGLPEEPFDN